MPHAVSWYLFGERALDFIQPRHKSLDDRIADELASNRTCTPSCKQITRLTLKAIFAGLTVSLALIPECLAFSFVANVPPLVSLQAAWIMCFVTALFNGCPGVISGAAGSIAVLLPTFMSVQEEQKYQPFLEFVPETRLGPHGTVGAPYSDTEKILQARQLAKQAQLIKLFIAVMCSGVMTMIYSLCQAHLLLKLVTVPVRLGFLIGLGFLMGYTQLESFETPEFRNGIPDTDQYVSGGRLYGMIVLTCISVLIQTIPCKSWQKLPLAIISIFVCTVLEWGVFRPLSQRYLAEDYQYDVLNPVTNESKQIFNRSAWATTLIGDLGDLPIGHFPQFFFLDWFDEKLTYGIPILNEDGNTGAAHGQSDTNGNSNSYEILWPSVADIGPILFLAFMASIVGLTETLLTFQKIASELKLIDKTSLVQPGAAGQHPHQNGGGASLASNAGRSGKHGAGTTDSNSNASSPRDRKITTEKVFHSEEADPLLRDDRLSSSIGTSGDFNINYDHHSNNYQDIDINVSKRKSGQENKQDLPASPPSTEGDVGIRTPKLRLKFSSKIRVVSSYQELFVQGVANLVCGLFGSMGGCAMIGQSLICVRNASDVEIRESVIGAGNIGRLAPILAALFTFTLTMYPVVLSIIPVSALVGVMLVVSYHTIDFRFLPAAWKAVFWSEEQKKKRFALVYNKGGLLVEVEEAEMELALAARSFVTERIHGKGINEEELLFGEEKEDEEALHNYIAAQAKNSSSKSAKKKKRGKKDSKFITVPRETNMKKDDPVFFPNFDPENPKLLIDPEHLTEEEESQLREEDAMLHASLQQMKKKSGSFFHHADFDHAGDGHKTPGINKSRTPSKMLIMTPIKKSGSKEQMQSPFAGHIHTPASVDPLMGSKISSISGNHTGSSKGSSNHDHHDQFECIQRRRGSLERVVVAASSPSDLQYVGEDNTTTHLHAQHHGFTLGSSQHLLLGGTSKRTSQGEASLVVSNHSVGSRSSVRSGTGPGTNGTHCDDKTTTILPIQLGLVASDRNSVSTGPRSRKISSLSQDVVKSHDSQLHQTGSAAVDSRHRNSTRTMIKRGNKNKQVGSGPGPSYTSTPEQEQFSPAGGGTDEQLEMLNSDDEDEVDTPSGTTSTKNRSYIFKNPLYHRERLGTIDSQLGLPGYFPPTAGRETATSSTMGDEQEDVEDSFSEEQRNHFYDLEILNNRANEHLHDGEADTDPLIPRRNSSSVMRSSKISENQRNYSTRSSNKRDKGVDAAGSAVLEGPTKNKEDPMICINMIDEQDEQKIIAEKLHEQDEAAADDVLKKRRLELQKQKEQAEGELPMLTKLDCLFVLAITATVIFLNLMYGVILGVIVCNCERKLLKREPWEDSEYFEYDDHDEEDEDSPDAEIQMETATRVLRNPAFPYPQRVASTEELLSVIMENTKQTHPYGCVLAAVERDNQVLSFQGSWKKLYGFTVQEDPTGQSIKDVCYCGVQQEANGPRWDNGLSELLGNPAGDDWDGVPVFIRKTGETIYVRRALSCVVGEQGLPGERPVNIKKQWHLQALGDAGSTLLLRNQRVLPRRHRNFAEGAQLAITISVLTARDPFGKQPLTFLLEPHPWTIAITSPPNYYDEEALYPESLVCNADWHDAVMLDTLDQLDEQDWRKIMGR
ncbi:unnamed protein product [Amoebophrya sp. A120]|nr:unnamed protein product [Amoebophrya sp. A120]|eukprot:GSA120T00014092001.1